MTAKIKFTIKVDPNGILQDLKEYCRNHRISQEQIENYVHDSLMQHASILRSGLTAVGIDASSWQRKTNLSEQEFRRLYQARLISGWCHPERNSAITGSWGRTVVLPSPDHPGQLQTDDYEWEHPQDEPLEIDEDSVFSPRPEYVPLELLSE